MNLRKWLAVWALGFSFAEANASTDPLQAVDNFMHVTITGW